METVRDAGGKVIATISHNQGRDSVYDAGHKFLGSTDKNSTRDPAGRIIANKPLPGLLIK